MALTLVQVPFYSRGHRTHLVPKTIPAAGEDIFVGDAYMEEVVITNPTGSAATVTITDKQGTPLALLSAQSIAANAVQVFEFTGRYCPGGIHWSGGTDLALVGSIRFRQ